MKLCRTGHHHSKVKQSYSFKVEMIILNSVVSICLGLALVHFDIDNLCYIANQSLTKKTIQLLAQLFLMDNLTSATGAPEQMQMCNKDKTVNLADVF